MSISDVFDNESRVAAMETRGREVIAQAVEHVTKTLQKRLIGFVAAFSGGDDSIVATHFANSELKDCVTFNADTTTGLAPTRAHIEVVMRQHKWAAEIIKATANGKPRPTPTNDELRANWRDGETAYEEFVLNHGFGGPPMHQRMYIILKERQLMKLRNKLRGGIRGGRIIVISGIRHDESAIRAGYKRAWQDVATQGITWVNPFYDFTAADFEAYRQEYGLPRNPVKRACGISGECCCGTFGSADERLAYRSVDPKFCEYLDALEAKVKERFPWGWAQSPPQWWIDSKQGQSFFQFDNEGPVFQPMCVGCNNGRR